MFEVSSLPYFRYSSKSTFIVSIIIAGFNALALVTNPPFSLFREYVAQLIKHDKKFLIIGNINAITYKEIFGLIKENKAWLGINLGRGISGFIVPEHYELYGTEVEIDASGNRIISPNNCLWLTNLDTF